MGLGSGGFRSNSQVSGGWLWRFMNMGDHEDTPTAGIWHDGSFRGPIPDGGDQVANVMHRRFAGGAAGDGDTDDYDAILAAIEYIHDLGGGTVFFPRGDFKCSGKLPYYSDIDFIGVSTRASIITYTGSEALFYNPDPDGTSVSWVDFRRLRLTGPGTSSAVGILVQNAEHVRVRDCYLGNWNIGVHILKEGDQSGSAYFRAIGNRITGCTTGIKAAGDKAGQTAIIEDNRISSGTTGIWFENDRGTTSGPTNTLRLNKNYFTNLTYGYRLQHTQYVTLIGNRFEDGPVGDLTGIRFDSTSTGTNSTQSDYTIIGNLYNCPTPWQGTPTLSSSMILESDAVSGTPRHRFPDLTLGDFLTVGGALSVTGATTLTSSLDLAGQFRMDSTSSDRLHRRRTFRRTISSVADNSATELMRFTVSVVADSRRSLFGKFEVDFHFHTRDSDTNRMGSAGTIQFSVLRLNGRDTVLGTITLSDVVTDQGGASGGHHTALDASQFSLAIASGTSAEAQVITLSFTNDTGGASVARAEVLGMMRSVGGDPASSEAIDIAVGAN